MNSLNLSTVNQSLSLTQDLLVNLVNLPQGKDILQSAFGSSFDLTASITWLETETENNFNNFPTLEILAQEDINNAHGAYSFDTNTIYLATEFVAQNANHPSFISRVILEEFGHFLDSQFNQIDTPGDEGELFAALVQGKSLTNQELVRIKNEEDRQTVVINNQTVQIEQANPGDNSAFDLIGLTELRNDPQFAGIDGSGLSVVVIDDGIDIDHPLLAPNYITGYDFAEEDEDPSDVYGHGTFVSGIIGATDETIGVAPDVNVISLRVFDDNDYSSWEDVEDSLEWILENREKYNITAVNMSLGDFGFYTSESEITGYGDVYSDISDDINSLEEAGVTVIASAGNDYDYDYYDYDYYDYYDYDYDYYDYYDYDYYDYYDYDYYDYDYYDYYDYDYYDYYDYDYYDYYDYDYYDYDYYDYDYYDYDYYDYDYDYYDESYQKPGINFPAISSTLAVGATPADSDSISSFSQRLDAPNVIFAPGETITSTLLGGEEIGGEEFYGTSLAAPHVAGAVALLQEASFEYTGEYLTTDEVVDILTSTGDIIVDEENQEDNVINTGDTYTRINVYNAVVEVKRRSENISKPQGQAQPSSVTVHRFFRSDIGTHFYTASEVEKDSVIESLPNYTYEGESYVAATETADPLTGAKPVYRFFNENTGAHLYTISEVEKDSIDGNLPNYNYEGVAYYGYESDRPGLTPLYRFYNPVVDTHFYTPSEVEKDSILANLPDYQLESNGGVAFYVEPII